MEPEFTKYYSPIEFCKISDIVLINHNSSFYSNYFKVNHSLLENKSRIIIFCTHCGLVWKWIVDNYLPIIEVPFVIISAFHDNSFPSITPNEPNDNCEQTIAHYVNIDDITSHKYFKHLFVINKNIPDNQFFTSIPHGLDYNLLRDKATFSESYGEIFWETFWDSFWDKFGESFWENPGIICGEKYPQNTLDQDEVLSSVIDQLKPIGERIPKIHLNAHLKLTDKRYGDWRRQLSSIIPEELVYCDNELKSRTKCWEEMGKYAFVISPHGNGLDCIRTFEALCLGCIVVLKTSCLDHIYQDLPVLIVKNYSDINKELLQNALNEFPLKKYNYDKLYMKYWISKVREAFE